MLTKITNLFLLIFGLLVLFGFSTNSVSAQCQSDCVCVINGQETYGSCGSNYGSCQGGPQGASCSCTLWGPNCGGSQCTSNAQCGSNQVCCQGQCVGQGQCGGSQCVPNATKVDCPAGYIKGTTVLSSQCGGRTCSGVGTAQETGACCGYVDPPRECGDWYPNPCGNDGPGGLPPCRRDCVDEEPYCVRSYLVTYNCVPICTSTAPSAPTLLSPADGTTVSTTSTTLTWNTSGQTWGTGCPTNNNQFEIFIGTTPNSLASAGTVSSNVGSFPFNGTSGQTYYWRIRARNGSVNTDSATRSFTINVYVTPWWQARDGDVTTNGNITSVVPVGELFGTAGLG